MSHIRYAKSLIIAIALPLFAQVAPKSGAFLDQRSAMVKEQIAARGVKDPRVLATMKVVPRELFVPEGERWRAYRDHPLAIGYGQTISQPYIVALMTELLEPRKDNRVLEIGTGSGYQAAVLSLLAGELYSIELVPELARSASATLARLGYDNVTVRRGDGYLGWPERAPFDRIILTAAPPRIPQALVDQLRPGGRLVAPVGEELQNLVVLTKDADGKTTTESILPVRFVPMRKAGN